MSNVDTSRTARLGGRPRTKRKLVDLPLYDLLAVYERFTGVDRAGYDAVITDLRSQGFVDAPLLRQVFEAPAR